MKITDLLKKWRLQVEFVAILILALLTEKYSYMNVFNFLCDNNLPLFNKFRFLLTVSH